MPEYTGTENLDVMAVAKNYNRFLASLIQNEASPEDIIVDYGAGIGTFAQVLSMCGSYHVHCIEPDSKQLARILGRGLTALPDLTCMEDNSVDMIYTLNVLEHIEDDVSALKTCHDKIKAGGRLLIYVPAFPCLYSSMDRNVGHLRRYTRTELSKKVNDAGFKVIKSEYVDCAGFLVSILFKILGNDDGTINKNALEAYDRYLFPLSRFGDMAFNKLFGKNIYLVALRL